MQETAYTKFMGQKETLRVMFCDQSYATILFEKIIYTKYYKKIN
jgi:hypothetical protein